MTDVPMLDRHGSDPLYRQLAAALQRRIDGGEFTPAARLPAEPELMAAYSVSRVTVRQATALLQQRGRLVVQRGKGTFVAQRVVQHDLDALRGFYDSLRRQGIEPQMRLLEFSADAGALDADCPAGLDLPVRLQRLYAVDGRPFALVVGYLPREAGALGVARAERLTVYQIVQDFLGRRVARAEVTIRCQPPRRDVARHLGIERDGQVLVMERRSFDADGAVAEFMRIHTVPERYEFHLTVSGGLEIVRAVHRVGADTAHTADPSHATSTAHTTHTAHKGHTARPSRSAQPDPQPTARPAGATRGAPR